jgi:hypothetical protein
VALSPLEYCFTTIDTLDGGNRERPTRAHKDLGNNYYGNCHRNDITDLSASHCLDVHCNQGHVLPFGISRMPPLQRYGLLVLGRRFAPLHTLSLCTFLSALGGGRYIPISAKDSAQCDSVRARIITDTNEP